MDLLNDAYVDIRQYIVDTWTQVNFLNDVGDVVLSRPIPYSTRVRWTHTTTRETVTIGYDLNGNPITGTVVFQTNPKMILRAQCTGAELTLPCKIASIEVVNPNALNSKTRIKKTMDNITTMTINADTFTYTLNLDVGE